jgi:hypothetical protein
MKITFDIDKNSLNKPNCIKKGFKYDDVKRILDEEFQKCGDKILADQIRVEPPLNLPLRVCFAKSEAFSAIGIIEKGWNGKTGGMIKQPIDEDLLRNSVEMWFNSRVLGKELNLPTASDLASVVHQFEVNDEHKQFLQALLRLPTGKDPLDTPYRLQEKIRNVLQVFNTYANHPSMKGSSAYNHEYMTIYLENVSNQAHIIMREQLKKADALPFVKISHYSPDSTMNIDFNLCLSVKEAAVVLLIVDRWATKRGVEYNGWDVTVNCKEATVS